MKKMFLFIFCVFLINTISHAQPPSFTIGFGMSSFDINTKRSSSNGLSFTGSIDRFYIDFSGNMASGKGEYLEFQSSKSYSANKISVGVINLGYIIPIKITYFAPVIGYGWSHEIYEDPIAFPTYFYGDKNTYINVGVIGGIIIDDNLGLNFGLGTYEKLKIGISLIFI